VNKAKIKQTLLIMAEGFSEKQILDQLMKLSLHIVTLMSSIRLDIIAYLVNNLHAKVLLEMNILTREEANIDLK